MPAWLGWELFGERWYWRATWESCSSIIKTKGTGDKEKRDQVSITDDHSQRTYPVTMENLQDCWCC